MLKSRLGWIAILFAVPVGAAVLSGCAGQDDPGPAVETQTSDAWKEGLDARTVAALSELPDPDRTAALEQRVCPVADGELGSMGPPVKLTVNGRNVFVCCASCEEPLRDEPEKYLSKLDDQQQ